MSPSHRHDDHHARREINGHRPSPLKINKDSHLIQKSFSSSSSSSSSSSVLSSAAGATKQQRQPVIIYTHSPKIIHTQARDFMALVQKLTGRAPSNESSMPTLQRHGSERENRAPRGNNNNSAGIGQDDNTSLSVVTDENCVSGKIQASSSTVTPIFDPPNPFFSEIPLFAPNSSELFCTPRSFYIYPDVALSGELDLPFQP